jgi:molecular chaperone DnaK
MVQEAKDHAAEDKKRRDEADAKNQLESAVYQVEKLLADLGDKAPVHEKARAEQTVADAKAALKDEAVSLERIKSLASDLQQVAQGLAQAAGAQQQGQEAAPQGEPSQAPGGDDVIDADFKQN